MRIYDKNTIYLEGGYFINIRNRDNTSYSILFGYCQRNIGCFLASGLPETGRKAIKKNCPLLFFHFGHRLVYNNLLRVQSCIVHLVEYRMPLILYFACHLLFRIIRFLTRLGQPENFSLLHYVLPGILAMVTLIWSLSVPFDVQLEIVRGRAEIVPAGYEAFARFYTLKPLFRVVFGLTYYLFAIGVLAVYYKRATGNKAIVHRPANWVLFIIGISLASLFSSVLPTFLMKRVEFYSSIWTLIVALSIAMQHVLLAYHVMRRDYVPYIITEKTPKQPKARKKHVPQTEEQAVETKEKAKAPRKQHSGKLNRRRFESFIRNEKPYLNPDYKITDLVEALDINRTTLSAFINRTYGANFNRYLNRLRLKELEKLRSQPDGQGKSISSLLDKAGFKDFRNYSRAAAAEREDAEQKNEADKKKGDTE